MSTLYVVRHGQASLFSDDYDRLSDLGHEQARALGECWRRAGLRFDHAWCGTLTRQTETAAAVAAAYQIDGTAFPELRTDPAFNEYPAEEILATFGAYLRGSDIGVAALADAFENAAGPADRYRSLHRLLEAVIGRWFAEEYGDHRPSPGWREWNGDVTQGLERMLASAGRGSATVLFTSGGVAATILQTVVQAPASKAAELNWRIHNAAVSQYTFSGKRISLDRFNDVAHLAPEQLTYR